MFHFSSIFFYRSRILMIIYYTIGTVMLTDMRCLREQCEEQCCVVHRVERTNIRFVTHIHNIHFHCLFIDDVQYTELGRYITSARGTTIRCHHFCCDFFSLVVILTNNIHYDDEPLGMMFVTTRIHH